MGRQVGRRRRWLPADRPRPRRQDDQPIQRHRQGGRRRARSRTGKASPSRKCRGKRTLTVDRVEFVGYGLDAPAAGHGLRGQGREGRRGRLSRERMDRRRSIRQTYRRILTGRSRLHRRSAGGGEHRPGCRSGDRPRRRAGARAARGRQRSPDFTTSSGSISRLPRPSPPPTSSSSSSSAGRRLRYDELKRKRRRSGAAAVVPSERRHAHVQRRRRLRSRPHAADAECRRRSSKAAIRS